MDSFDSYHVAPEPEDLVGKKTFLRCTLTKVLAPYEWIPGFWDRRSDPPRVVFIVSLPRAGSTVAKRFLGDHPRITLSGMSPSHNWWDAWSLQRFYHSVLDRVVLDKRTLYIYHLDEIIRTFRRHVRLLLLVRDPRDQLLSLRNFERHQSYPRDERFYDLWTGTYRSALETITSLDFGGYARLLRYEDLVEAPGEVKRSFLEWVSLPPARIGPGYRTQDESILEEDTPSEDEETHRHNSIHQQSLQKWKDNGTVPGVTSPEAKTLMEKLGYDPLEFSETPGLNRVETVRNS